MLVLSLVFRPPRCIVIHGRLRQSVINSKEDYYTCVYRVSTKCFTGSNWNIWEEEKHRSSFGSQPSSDTSVQSTWCSVIKSGDCLSEPDIGSHG
ncbi:hypothetical protein CLF_113354 [Clonorchis sinensis]|uniref:Uncharacterized protein n=1 Tax=Clonorchis sinensis TaxID=79923 RepID=G7YY95_CLOSI|nr:hypothetical protein CLF_113354 [Clonorchis sinensis]